MQRLETTGFLAAAAAPTNPDGASDWIAVILKELGQAQAAGLAMDVAKGILLGALAGIALAVVVCLLFSRKGWYEVPWRYARGVRWTIYALTVLLSAILLGLAGFWSGVVQGSERVLTNSQLAGDVLPKIGEAIADGMAWIQLRAGPAIITSENEFSQRLDEFRAGKWELNAAQFSKNLHAFQEATVTNLIVHLEQSTLERAPQLKGGIGEKLLHDLLSRFGQLLVEKKMESELKKVGCEQIYLAIRKDLAAEAAKSGNKETIARNEISIFLVREGIVPGLANPIRAMARSQQIIFVGMTLVVIAVPPLCLRLARKKVAKSDITPPPAPRACP